MTEKIDQIEVCGLSIGYSVHGGGGHPLLFVHGYAMRGTDGPYDELIALLARRYSVHVVDLPGHGASQAPPGEWSVWSLAEVVTEFARRLHLGRPAYVGHSLGGLVGLLAEIRHPGTFAALCLLTPAAADSNGGSPEAVQLLIEQGRNKEAMRAMFRHMFVRPPGDVLDAVAAAVGVLGGEVHRQYLTKLAEISIGDRLGEIDAPVLLVNGERDVVVPPALQHEMARRLMRSKEVVFSGEGHMLPSEAAAAAAREILRFLGEDLPLSAAHPAAAHSEAEAGASAEKGVAR